MTTAAPTSKNINNNSAVPTSSPPPLLILPVYLLKSIIAIPDPIPSINVENDIVLHLAQSDPADALTVEVSNDCVTWIVHPGVAAIPGGTASIIVVPWMGAYLRAVPNTVTSTMTVSAAVMPPGRGPGMQWWQHVQR